MKYKEIYPTCPNCLNESLKVSNIGKDNVFACDYCKAIYYLHIDIVKCKGYEIIKGDLNE